MFIGFCKIIGYEYVLKTMPSETNVMGSVSKQEEDTEQSNESITLTLNSTNQVSSIPTKQTNTHTASVNSDKVSISDIRNKFLNSTGNAVSLTSNNSTAKNDSLQAETLCSRDKTGLSKTFQAFFTFHGIPNAKRFSKILFYF